MKKPYYKELPLLHIYDSDLTGSQKLLMTLTFKPSAALQGDPQMMCSSI